MATAVVCDSDSVLRSSVSGLCEAAGLQVVAETDRGGDALELVRRFAVDVVVIDLSLGDGSGEHWLQAIRDDPLPPSVVVFTAYAHDAAHLVRLGARAVVEKPDLEGPARVLQQVRVEASASMSAATTEDRRSHSRPVDPLPTLWASPSGICSAGDLARSLDGTIEGDAVLAVAVLGTEHLAATVGDALAADCWLTPGRLLRQTLRVQDVVHDAPLVHGVVAVLRGGDARAGEAVWDRLCELARALTLPGPLGGAHARIDHLGPDDAIARAVGALMSMDPASPALGRT